MATLTSLLVKLGLETASLRRDLGRSRRQFRRFSQDSRRELGKVQQGFASIGKAARLAGGALAAVGLTSIASDAIRAASETLKFSRTLGTTAENLSSLSFVAARSNVQFSTLAQLLQRQTRRIGEAAKGYGEARNVLRELNLDAQRLSELDSVDVFRQLAPILRAASTEAEALRIATKLFDTEGAQAALRLVRELESVEAQAAKLGVVINTEAAEALERLEDRFTTLGQSIKVNFLNSFGRAVKEIEDFPRAVRTALGEATESDILRNLEEEIQQVERALKLARQDRDQILGFDGTELSARSQRVIRTNFLRSAQAYREGTAELARLREQRRQLLGEPLDVPAGTEQTDTPQQQATGARRELLGPRAGINQFVSSIREEYAAVAQYLTIVNGFTREVQAAEDVIAQLRNSTLSTEGQIAVRLAEDLQRLREAGETAGRSRAELVELERALSRTAAARIAELTSDTQETVAEVDRFANQLEAISERAAQNMQDAFAEFLFNPFEDGLKGMLRSFIDTIRRMVANAAASKVFGALFGKGGASGGSNPLSGLFSTLTGAASSAGAVTGASAAGVTGSSKSNGFGSGKAGVVINQTIDARGADASLAARLPAILQAASRETEARVYDTFRRGLVPG